MKKLTVKQYSKEFKISENAIRKKIARKSIKSELKNGKRYIIIDEEKTKEQNNNQKNKPKQENKSDDQFLQHLIKENERLQEEKNELKTKLGEKDEDIKDLQNRFDGKRDDIEKYMSQIINLQ
ncbi:MAG: hypothetical protein HQK84_10925, partial [Nitrospinae bacterium]|nr:hypothetical protein [Nitrospinota bacterium]